jgi:hypothetical protein
VVSVLGIRTTRIDMMVGVGKMSATISGSFVQSLVSTELVSGPITALLAMSATAASPLARTLDEQTRPGAVASALNALAVPLSAAATDAGARRIEANLTSEIDGLTERWTDELLPRANALIRRIAALELDGDD